MDYDEIYFHPLPRERGRKGKFEYAAEIAAFDIESTRIPEIEQSFMYVWQFSVDNRLVIMGRTWEQFLHMMTSLRDRLDGLRLMVFIHVMNYEMSFISSPEIYQFSNDEVFCLDSHKIMRAYMYGKIFELRDSHVLTNLSLDALTRKYNCQYRKRSGEEFDYDKIRLPSTPLTRKELLYCAYDVLGLVEAMRAQLAANDDTLYTLPHTQTGYVRRRAKTFMAPHHWKIMDCYPDPDLFRVLRQAFRGGNTHANRFFSGEILDNVHGVDISSAYPTQQVLERYPVEPFRKSGRLSTHVGFMERMVSEGRHCVFTARFESIRLRNRYEPIPYIPRAKCLDPWGGVCRHYRMDNGRVLSSEGLPLTIALTEVDWRIVSKQYEWDKVELLNLWVAASGPLYEGLRQLNIDLFREKTALRGIPEKRLYYDRSKEQLNSIYGMSCQNPVRQEILFECPGRESEWSTEGFVTDTSMSTDVLLANSKKTAFITYQLGVYTTAHSRAQLQRGIDALDKNNVVYCDTDSIMYIGQTSDEIERINEEYRERQLVAGGWADDAKGQRHYMGMFEHEDDPRHGYKFARFITHGAKKYAFEKWDKNDRLQIGITVAGVPKTAGAEELARKGGLEAFKPGFVFSECGKLGVIYNDDYGDYEINGETVHITRNACLVPVSYTLGYEKDYAALIANISQEKLDSVISRTIMSF